VKPLITLLISVNALFLICHPLWASALPGPVQTLGVALAIALGPALPFIGILQRGRRPAGFSAVAAAIISTVALILVLVIWRVLGLTLSATSTWNGVWLVSNIALVAAARAGILAPVRFVRTGAAALTAVVFVCAYGLFYWGAVRVVPVQYDHDLEVQATGYGLLSRFEPFLLTDRNTIYYFAHPPLLHFYTAASLMYFDEVGVLKQYDDASLRALASSKGEPFAAPPLTFRRVRESGRPPAYPQYRVTSVQESDYIVSPPLPDGGTRLAVKEAELATVYATYAQAPLRQEGRAPNVFFAALAVALLATLLVERTRSVWFAGLVVLAYATSPEVFVRSSYGGYFAAGSFALLAMMSAEMERSRDRGMGPVAGILAGAFAAWIDHKLVLFPLALGLWHWWRLGLRRPANAVAALRQPVVLGFAIGMTLYWVYGALINPSVFWLDHVRTHLFDRVVHNNPLGYNSYPTVAAMWREFTEHTGYLLPLATAALAALAWSGGSDQAGHAAGQAAGRADAENARAWIVYVVMSSLLFSWVDWRMTKHLMLLLPVLFLAWGIWTARNRVRLVASAALLVAVSGWNIWTLRGLATNFSAFHVSPDW
jgi:hypothetical protein